MKKIPALLAALACCLCATAQPTSIYPDGYEAESCTSLMVGRLASADGSVMTSHTCDGVSHTWTRVEAAADHAPGTLFLVRKGTRHTKFPGDTAGVKIVGAIPEAAHTYAYLDTGYPSLNEKQLAIGETTFTGPDTLINKESIFLIEELARLALMRCDNARDAVLLMGRIAEQYGYGDTGECLTVADKNEVWQFEIVGIGRHATGAAWAAKRVPDGHIAVSANIPRIGVIDRSDPDLLCSDNLESVALQHGLWDGQGPFVFWKAFHGKYGDGRNYKEREFFILNHFAPSLGLNMDMDELPFSVKPEKPVSLSDATAIFRSTYEGTELDMCRKVLMERTVKGQKDTIVSPVANPWLVADTRNTLNTIAPGTVDFTRTVAVCWCSYSTVIQLRNWLPDAVGGICWWAADNPGQSPRIPLFAGNTELPAAFGQCGQKQYVPDSVLWTFRRPNRLGTVAWQKNKKLFLENILAVESMALEGLPAVEQNPTTEALNGFTARIYQEAAARWTALEEQLWIKHGRGF